jgi:hypothetical protein
MPKVKICQAYSLIVRRASISLQGFNIKTWGIAPRKKEHILKKVSE